MPYFLTCLTDFYLSKPISNFLYECPMFKWSTFSPVGEETSSAFVAKTEVRLLDLSNSEQVREVLDSEIKTIKRGFTEKEIKLLTLRTTEEIQSVVLKFANESVMNLVKEIKSTFGLKASCPGEMVETFGAIIRNKEFDNRWLVENWSTLFDVPLLSVKGIVWGMFTKSLQQQQEECFKQSTKELDSLLTYGLFMKKNAYYSNYDGWKSNTDREEEIILVQPENLLEKLYNS